MKIFKKMLVLVVIATIIVSLVGCGKKTGKTYYVSNIGVTNNSGSKKKPWNLETALNNVAAGDTINLLEGKYQFSSRLNVSAKGAPDKMITLQPFKGAKVEFDFSSMEVADANRGIQLTGSYWHIKDFEVHSAGDNGIYIGGNYNIVENMDVHDNKDTGIQLGRSFSENTTIDTWPHDNLILNCTSYNNCDLIGENADGFACKLTTGENNVFDGCIAYNNSDDGWDLYTKGDTGKIGSVVMKNCISFNNGLLTDMKTVKKGSDGNGFKFGGTSIAVNHYIENCLAFNNLTTGFTDNSNPGIITIKNSTSFNNGEMSKYLAIEGDEASPNFAMARTVDCEGAYEGLLSIATNGLAGNDDFKGVAKNNIFYTNNANYKITAPIDSDSRTPDKIGLPYLGSTNVFKQTALADYSEGYLRNLHKTLRDEKGNLKLGDLFALKDDFKNANPGIGADFNNLIPTDFTLTQVEKGKTGDELMVAQAYNDVRIPGLHDAVIRNLLLPTKTANGCTVTWESNNADVISNTGAVKTPNATTEVKLTATITYGDFSRTKEFVLSAYVPATQNRVDLFEENFNYGNNAFLGSTDNWDYSGSASSANVVATVPYQNIPNNAGALTLRGSSTVSLFTNAVRFSTTNKTVLEFDFLQYGNSAGFSIEFMNGSTSVLSVGAGNHSVKIGSNIVKNNLLDGVWYTVRVVIDPTTKQATVYLYDLSNRSAVQIGTTPVGTFAEDMTVKINNSFNSEMTGLTYITGLQIGSESEITTSEYTNYNIAAAISEVKGVDGVKQFNTGDSFVSDASKIEVFDRFNPTQKLVLNTDYKIDVLNAPTGNTAGKFIITYRITLLKVSGYIYDIEQVVYYVVDGAATEITEFKASTLLGGSITFTTTSSRPDGVFYYLIVESGSPMPTAEQIKAGTQVTGFMLAGSYGQNDLVMSKKIDASSLNIDLLYDVYIVAINPSTDEISNAMSAVSIGSSLMISSFEDIVDMCAPENESAYRDATIKLSQDIDCGGKGLLVTAPWIFRGTFDGQGFTISNLDIIGSADNTGFWQKIRGGVVKDITFVNVNATNTSKYTAIVAGKAEEGTTVSNVKFVDCEVITQTQFAGLIYSRIDKAGDLIFTNISVENGTVKGDQYVGMLFGGDDAAKNITLTNISIQGSVHAYGKNVGGVMGRNTTGTVTLTNAVIYANVTSGSQNLAEAGAIIGNKTGTQSTFIENVVLRGSFFRQATDDTGLKNPDGTTKMSYAALIGRMVAVGPTNEATNFVSATNVYYADMIDSTYMALVTNIDRSNLTQDWYAQTLHLDFNIWKWSTVSPTLKNPNELKK